MTATLHRGKLARIPQPEEVRELTREDMAVLGEPRPPQNRPKAMRESHHRLARMIAAGFRIEEILSQTGYSATRLQQLQKDPAFQELIAAYKEKVDEAYIRQLDNFWETATSNMRRMECMVEEHLDAAEEANERIPLKTLIAAIADRADRFGYSKKTINRNENVDFARVMEEMARASGRSNVIDAKAISPTSSAGSGSGDGGRDG